MDIQAVILDALQHGPIHDSRQLELSTNGVTSKAGPSLEAQAIIKGALDSLIGKEVRYVVRSSTEGSPLSSA